MEGCPPLSRLREEREHVAACADCREKLAALELLDAPESPEERRALDALDADPRRMLAAARLRAGPGALRIRRRPPWIAAAAVVAACAAAVAVFMVRTTADPAAALREAQGASRPLEVALDGLPWAPYQPRRGAREASLDRALRRLLEAREKKQPGAERALATLYLLRGEAGDVERAEEALAQAGEAENGRGAIRYLQGDFAGALDEFLRAGAQFNAALALEKLGAREPAARLFESVKGLWSGEAAQRAQALRKPAPSVAPSPRREAYLALLAAGTPRQLAEAERAAQGMPDLLAAARRLAPAQLPEHARLYAQYVSLRARALAGGTVSEVEEFARRAAVQGDPLLWAPALQLAGYAHAARGNWREAQRYYGSLASACRARGCVVENEAIALDELADLAARDGDFARARRLQESAEKLFSSVGAALQLAELHRKRAAFLDEQNRSEEASRAAGEALRELSGLGESAAYGPTLAQAAQIEGGRGHLRAEEALGEAALELARAAGNRDLEVDVAALLATSALALGRPADARARLENGIARLSAAGHPSGVASLRRRLGEALLAQGDAAVALAEAERGLALVPAGAWESDRVLLHLVHARGLRALQREGEALAELSRTLDEVARDAAGAAEPAPWLAQASGLLAETSLPAKTADELALPLDRLRAAALHVAPAAAGWSRSLAEGACVLVLVPAKDFTLQGVARREGGDVRRIGQGGDLLAGTDRCEELWVFAGAPLDALDLPRATGVATSLSRLLADEPRDPPRSALFVSAQASGDIAVVATPLPGAEAERAAIERLGTRVVELSGERATPELALQLAAGHPLLHFAVHGFEGGFLQLAGEGGRLASRDIARARLRAGTRVVLSACESGTPEPAGVAWSFARAGAAVVLAARGKVDDAAAARWSGRFYAAVGRGLDFAQAAQQAGQEDRAARFLVVK